MPRPDPYVPRNPNDLLRSTDWNEIQVRTREDVQNHNHTGGEQGVLIGSPHQVALADSHLARVPDDRLTDAERALRAKLADLPALSIIQLVYQQAAWEGQAKDYDFSQESMRAHWSSGLRDTRNTLAHRDWLDLPPEEVGIVTHDIHRPTP